MERVRITPEMARDWLTTRNGHNRNMRPQVAEAYARDIAAGNWFLDGTPIQFDTEGLLLNGQHRLMAIVTANVPVDIFVARDVDPQAFAVIDKGPRRSVADSLHLDGIANATGTAATVRFLLSREHAETAGAGVYTYVSKTWTTPEVREWIAHHPEIRQSVEVGKFVSKRIGFSPTALASAHWLTASGGYAEYSPDEATDFLHSAADGVGLEDGSPELALIRVARSRNVSSLQGKNTALRTIASIALTIKAMNAYRAGRTIRMLRWSPQEEFPTVWRPRE